MSDTRNGTITANKSIDLLFNDYSDVFFRYLLRKSILTAATSLTEHALTERGYTPVQTERIKNIVYLSIIAFQGSLHTSGSSFFSSELLKYLGYSEDGAYWVGFAVGTGVSLYLDFTPWGVTKTVLSTAGGLTGKWCTQWAYKKIKHYRHPEQPASLSEPLVSHP